MKLSSCLLPNLDEYYLVFLISFLFFGNLSGLQKQTSMTTDGPQIIYWQTNGGLTYSLISPLHLYIWILKWFCLVCMCVLIYTTCLKCLKFLPLLGTKSPEFSNLTNFIACTSMNYLFILRKIRFSIMPFIKQIILITWILCPFLEILN